MRARLCCLYPQACLLDWSTPKCTRRHFVSICSPLYPFCLSLCSSVNVLYIPLAFVGVVFASLLSSAHQNVECFSFSIVEEQLRHILNLHERIRTCMVSALSHTPLQPHCNYVTNSIAIRIVLRYEYNALLVSRF